MERVTKLLLIMSLVCICGIIAVGTVHGQNFGGTVSPEPASQPLGSDSEPTFIKESLEQPVISKKEAEEASKQEKEIIQNLSWYTLGKTDVIEIIVLRHPEVSGEYVINNEGTIQYEFVGDVKIEGMTKDQVKDDVTKLLAEYIISPEVTVKIVGYNSKIVYVIGEVGGPGKIFMRGDTITVREALMQAGLPLLSANTRQVKLITPSADGTPEQKKVDVHKLLYEGDLRENLVMNPGDSLYIPATFMAKTMRILNPVAQPIGTASGLGRTMTTGF